MYIATTLLLGLIASFLLAIIVTVVEDYWPRFVEDYWPRFVDEYWPRIRTNWLGILAILFGILFGILFIISFVIVLTFVFLSTGIIFIKNTIIDIIDIFVNEYLVRIPKTLGRIFGSIVVIALLTVIILILDRYNLLIIVPVIGAIISSIKVSIDLTDIYTRNNEYLVRIPKTLGRIFGSIVVIALLTLLTFALDSRYNLLIILPAIVAIISSIKVSIDLTDIYTRNNEYLVRIPKTLGRIVGSIVFGCIVFITLLTVIILILDRYNLLIIVPAIVAIISIIKISIDIIDIYTRNK